jgi:lactoylglutathione lyase
MTSSTPGVRTDPDEETRAYLFNHVMLRVKDAKRSLDFYTRILGMHLLKKLDFEQARFTLYFLGMLPDPAALPDEGPERTAWIYRQPAVLELTHNWGTESDESVRMHSGNEEPRGFGHLCITVPDIEAACRRFDDLGVMFQKRLGEGRMKEIAFIKDPDGYWIEIIQADLMARVLGR